MARHAEMLPYPYGRTTADFSLDRTGRTRKVRLRRK